MIWESICTSPHDTGVANLTAILDWNGLQQFWLAGTRLAQLGGGDRRGSVVRKSTFRRSWAAWGWRCSRNQWSRFWRKIIPSTAVNKGLETRIGQPNHHSRSYGPKGRKGLSFTEGKFEWHAKGSRGSRTKLEIARTRA